MALKMMTGTRMGATNNIRRSTRHGFTMVELLVVIAIIAVLAGVLLVALGKASEASRNTSTKTTMEAFAAACQTFQIEHGQYPGVIPDRVLEEAATNGVPPISGMENALLHLMGGYRVLQPSDVGTDIETEYNAYTGTEITFGGTGWRLKVATNAANEFGQLGDGPVIDGKKYTSYFTPGEGQLAVARGQVNSAVDLPELVDAWGTPIVYVRQIRKSGPLVGDPTDINNLPQFALVSMNSYVQSTGLGERGISQTDAGGNTRSHSLFDHGDDTEDINTMELLLEHPSIQGQAKGAFMLWSAGADGVYLSRADGMFTPEAPCGDPEAGVTFAEMHNAGSKIIEEWDDVVIFGGG